MKLIPDIGGGQHTSLPPDLTFEAGHKRVLPYSCSHEETVFVSR